LGGNQANGTSEGKIQELKKEKKALKRKYKKEKTPILGRSSGVLKKGLKMRVVTNGTKGERAKKKGYIEEPSTERQRTKKQKTGVREGLGEVGEKKKGETLGRGKSVKRVLKRTWGENRSKRLGEVY